jgi:hypothetical protein
LNFLNASPPETLNPQLIKYRSQKTFFTSVRPEMKCFVQDQGMREN